MLDSHEGFNYFVHMKMWTKKEGTWQKHYKIPRIWQRFSESRQYHVLDV